MNSSGSFSILDIENFKEIEDVIDARKRLGQYNVLNLTNALRGIHSNHQQYQNKPVKFDLSKNVSATSVSGIARTDSEITIFVLKAKCTSKRKSKWGGMDDIAIPGDGTHLGDSPSLVNLATLVTQNAQCEGEDEYLVPLSSWDPYIKTEDISNNMKFFSETSIHDKRHRTLFYADSNNINANTVNSNEQTEFVDDEVPQTTRSSWAGRFSKFWRKQWRKRKTLVLPDAAGNAGIGREQQR
ncbi:unnamed protein product [Ceutorhynchus assimilis]|uniref:Uncharacterized protein n=1 Tax=Ceutorhynchus assimilis TaxID=467358 RepID=A0A9N9QQS5_9CUCU|nr:unnamed protein product [Ceutorhynchus assimilis]